MNPSDPRRPGRIKGKTAWIALVVVLVLPGAWAWNTALTPDPADIVRDYLEAILDRDVEAALALTDVEIFETGEDLPAGTYYGTPVTADETGMLHPDAINDDWEVLSVAETDQDWGTLHPVRAVIGHADGTAEFDFTVSEEAESLIIVDALATVEFAPGPHLFIRTGDQTLEFEKRDVPFQVPMFPGVYQFSGINGDTPPVAIGPGSNTTATDTPVQTAVDLVTPEQVAEADRQVRALIDECEASEELIHHPCPFGLGSEAQTEEGDLIPAPYRPSWEIVEYPTVDLEFTFDDSAGWQLRPRFTDPGQITLSGTGPDADGNDVDVEVPCRFAATELFAYFHTDGELEIAWNPRQLNPEDDWNNAYAGGTCLTGPA